MKKYILLMAIIASFVLLFIIIANIVNSYVSYKYEIEEPPLVDCIDIELASVYLSEKIIWLKFFLCYVITSIVLLVVLFFKRQK